MEHDLNTTKLAALLAGLEHVLARWGKDVCEREWGKNLGQGLYEFRIRHSGPEIEHMFGGGTAAGGKRTDKVLLRVFFHPYGDKVLLLHGYDKGVRPGEQHQRREIERARASLRAFLQRRKK